MPAEEYVGLVRARVFPKHLRSYKSSDQASQRNILGEPLLMTQHFIGGTKWEKLSDAHITGYHQMRVAHQRYKASSRTEVAVKGHAHGFNTHSYRNVDGVWKQAGICHFIRWSEYDLDHVRDLDEAGDGETSTNVVIFGPTGAVASIAALAAQEHGAQVTLAMRDPSKTVQALSMD